MKPEKVYIFPFLIEFSNLQVRFREKKLCIWVFVSSRQNFYLFFSLKAINAKN